MKKRWKYCAVTAVLAAVLTGCGDGTEGEDWMKSLDEVVDPVILTDAPESEGGESTQAPEATSEPEPGKAGLQSSGGELSPEVEAAVLESLKNLQQNMELADYIGEAIHLVSSEEWFETVAAGLYEGCRSYTIGGAGEASLSVQVGYDVEEKPYINAWYQNEGQILLLKEAGGVVRLLQTSLSGGVYNGAFEKWRIDGPAGHILKETGSYANGVMVGEYTKSEYKGGTGEAFDLWMNRENFTYETTTVMYDEKGEIAATATPEPQATVQPTAQPTAKPTTQPTAKPTAKPTTQPTAKPTAQPTPEPPQPTPEPPQSTPEPPQPTPEPPQPTPEPPQPTPEPPQPTPEPPQPTPEPPQSTPEPPSVGDTDTDWSPDMM